MLPASYGRSVGDTVDVLTAGAERPMTVSGVTDGDDVLVPDPLAEKSAAGVSLIGVVTAAEADTTSIGDLVRDVVGPASDVYTDDERGAMESEFDASNNRVGQQLLVLIGALAVFVSVFAVGTTFTFQVSVRRRELALLRRGRHPASGASNAARGGRDRGGPPWRALGSGSSGHICWAGG